MAALSVEMLKAHLDFNPITGIFTRKKSASFNPLVKIGSKAGHLGRDGYIYVRVMKARYLAHRLAWFYTYGYWPDAELDHINCNKSDNSIANLREANRSQNMANTFVPSNSNSGVKGVCFDKASNKWLAHINVSKKFRNLGRFNSFKDAVIARQSAEKTVFGEFARIG